LVLFLLQEVYLMTSQHGGARGGRWGFTLIELLVVIAIIAVLAAFTATAVQKANDASKRMQCQANMRQIGLALNTYYDTYNHFPDAGEGTLYSNNAATPQFDYSLREAQNTASGAGFEPPLPGIQAVTFFYPNAGPTPPSPGINGPIGNANQTQSVFTRILPFVETEDLALHYNLNFAYNDTTNAPNNIIVAQTVVTSFLCPANPLRPQSGADSAGFGYTDYGATVYCDLDPVTGVRNKNARMNGALHGTQDGRGTTKFDIADGLSRTIAIAEDVGRYEAMPGAYPDPLVAGSQRSFWRWAEPDNGFGVSGDPRASSDDAGTINTTYSGLLYGRARVINNNKTPLGGGAALQATPRSGDAGGCNWLQIKSNCGPNDEIFSFHGKGANVVFIDGHVAFLSEDIDAIVIRRLVTAAERIAPNAQPLTGGTAYGGGIPLQADADY
jgi:prepilin-type N-terminal cleavage/methylation domain-containing protein/prepilin-type processing-associated H-X9-DG protein